MHEERHGDGEQRDAGAQLDRKRKAGGRCDGCADEDGDQHCKRRDRPETAIDFLEVLLAAGQFQAVVENCGIGAGLERLRQAPRGV
jgi:hypothetical protein